MVSLAPAQLLLGCIVLLSLNTDIEVFTQAYLMGNWAALFSKSWSIPWMMYCKLSFDCFPCARISGPIDMSIWLVLEGTVVEIVWICKHLEPYDPQKSFQLLFLSRLMDLRSSSVAMDGLQLLWGATMFIRHLLTLNLANLRRVNRTIWI